jgi:hypothetical protein
MMKRLAAFMLLLAEIGGAYAGNGDAERPRTRQPADAPPG